MRYSLPQEPNIREELARNLALESSHLGLGSEARAYRLEEIRAREEHLLGAISRDLSGIRSIMISLDVCEHLGTWFSAC